MKIYILIIYSVILTKVSSFGQYNENTKDNLNEIRMVDISEFWTTERIRVEEDTLTIERQEPLGFIGDNYQRFYIHFISVIKDPDNNTEYFVYGKTSVKNNICEFQGKITVKEAITYVSSDLSSLTQGWIKGTYEFYENPNERGSGVLKGDFKTDFFIDQAGMILYNGLMLGADGFENNQFEGTWTSYSTAKCKKCNWGDYRIPDSGDLDVGAGEFSPSEKYITLGWG